MILLDHLLQIEKIESPEERNSYATGLYMTNKTFARLCDLAYRRSVQSRYMNGEEFPKYKQDPVPYGYNYSQLERIFNKLKVAGFFEEGRKSLPDNIANRKLVQVFESLSDVECRFVQFMLRKDIPWFDRESWKVAKHS